MEEYEVRLCENEAEIKTALDIREKVFIKELHVPEEIERDEFDKTANHFLVFADEQAVAAGRSLMEGDICRIGRMAVLELYRRQGVGRALLKEILQQARKNGAKSAVLFAKASARTFYYSQGFIEEGEPFFEANIPHIKMNYSLDN